MSILKSKVLVGTLVVAAILVGFAVVATDANAQVSCSITSTLRQGSAGTDVMCLQTKLGITADGKFGPMTAAAVKAFQASKGLVADGVAGPMTIAALGGVSVSMPGLPVGCTSTSGYSTATGVKCDSSTGTNLPAGCSSAVGFSSTTGKKCDGSEGGSTSNGPLEGEAGDLNGVDVLSTYSGEEVLEGDEDVKVMAFELEADNGSDLAIKSVKLGFANTELVAGASKRMDNMIDEVKVWMGDEEVGAASSDDFSESDDVYSKSIALEDAVVRAGEKEKFYVTVSSVSNVDSGDLNNDWTIALESVRFEDADGVVTTDSTTGDLGTHDYTNNTTQSDEQRFSFQDLTSSGDIELKVSKDSSSPDALALSVDETSDTNDVLFLAAKMKAEGTDMTVDKLEFNIYPVGAAENEIVKEWKLLVDGEEIDAISAGTTAAGATGTIVFTNLEDDFVISEGDTVVVKVLADVNDIEGNFGNGDSIKVSLEGTANVDDETNTVVDDENGDTVENTDRSGSAVGEAQTFYTDGIQVSLVSVDQDVTTAADPATNGSAATGTFVIKFKVTAFGDDIYVDKDAVEDTASPYDTVTQVSYSMLNTGSVAASSASLQSTGDLKNDSFLVEEGTTETFTLTVAGKATADVFTNVKLEAIGYKVGSDAAGDTLYTSDLDNFKTGDLYLEFI